MENQPIEKETLEQNQPTQKKKGLKWLWITLAIVAVLGIGAWFIYNVLKPDVAVKEVYSLATLLVGIFIITALGYLLGSITIKGVNLGTAGVFLVAILFGVLCTLIPENVPILKEFILKPKAGNTLYYKNVIQNIGLVMFVGAVGFTAGPKFFRDLKKNFKTYIFMGVTIILIGTIVTLMFIFISPSKYGSDFWAGILSGALTTTPGYSAAQEACKLKEISDTYVTIGHAIAYPFGVIGVVLFVQLIPKFTKANMDHERSLLKVDFTENVETKPAKKLFEADNLGFTALAIAIISGLLVGAIKIPLFNGVVFTLGTTGGVLILCLIFGHFGRIGKLSMHVPEATLKVLKELGLMLFLIGAGVEGGVSLIGAVSGNAGIVVWGFLGGVCITLIPMIVGFFICKYLLKLPLLNNLGSITGGMTSTPALGTLISTAKTEDVAGAYASTYPIALVLIVFSCNLMIMLI